MHTQREEDGETEKNTERREADRDKETQREGRGRMGEAGQRQIHLF